jgi:uncharacterized membrane protein
MAPPKSGNYAGALVVRGPRDSILKFFEGASSHGLRVVFVKVADDPESFFFVKELRRRNDWLGIAK